MRDERVLLINSFLSLVVTLARSYLNNFFFATSAGFTRRMCRDEFIYARKFTIVLHIVGFVLAATN